ncbi:MAG: SDR family oxidoreductase [Anaerolineae bacterium]|nr:SDR family oxidoreductase [Anaerolineae bacterium]
MMRFAGKVALVTGAARGIGAGIARRLATEGADIAINDVANMKLAHALAADIREMGRQAAVYQADVADRPAITAMIGEIVTNFGHLDIAVANAAINLREPIIEAAWENVQRTVEVAQFGVFHCCQLAAQQMIRQPVATSARGKIVIISSVHSELPVRNSAAYNMAKAAINHFGRTLALELAPHHINVNIISPGWINTPGERAFSSKEALRDGGHRIPWGRLGHPDDIGKAAAFLCSEDADYITGAELRVDGGFVLGLALPT